ncbi:MAG: nucleoside diphosphate kinase regulator [Sphingomonadales bacterium]|nr:nucleoside diphosphate kinase regulator [Sphingomonadales bacterium]MDE2567711.1 nucleoside diphosphate kinase regulator [Sphingomonadales bacterium]
MSKSNTLRRPPIHMIDVEADALTSLALAARGKMQDVSEPLLEEIARAEIHTAAGIAPDVVTMHSTVEFLDEGSGAGRVVELVYPRDADIAAGRISILTPVGAGLIGLRTGQSIVWPDRDGRERRLTIVEVRQERPAA